MDTRKVVYSKVEDFLKDDDFIKYVLGDAPETAARWEELIREHAELLEVLEEAKEVLLAPVELMDVMDSSEEKELKHRIFATLELNE